MKQVVSDFPLIDNAYDDEFGRVDPEVYFAAKTIWPHAEHLAVKLLQDSHRGLELMLEAVARVSRFRAQNNGRVTNLNSYLYRSFKNLLLADLEQENNRRKILRNRQREDEIRFDHNEEERINRKILINELRLRMDDWTRDVFDLLRLGYKYEELVPDYGTAANVIRSKFSKKTTALAATIRTALTETDEKIDSLR